LKRIITWCLLFAVLVIPFRAEALGTSAKAAILINAATGEVIFEQNADERLPMASTTKIMTALLLCEYGNFEKEITVTAEMLRVEGSSMGLLAGDKVTLHDLLYGLMLASGNDAANVVAFTLGGTVNGFVKQMNDKAKALGLGNTNFVTPSGLDAEEHYTTARDLAKLTRFALENDEFSKAAACETAVLNYGNPPYRRSLTNHNKLLKTYENAIGVKTGFTKKSGRCLVSAAESEGKKVIAVTLNDPDDWQDHKAMLEYGLNSLKTAVIEPPCSEYVLPVIGGNKESVTLEIKPYEFGVVDDGDLSCTVNLPKFVYAPLKKGEQVGSVIYKKGDEIIAESPIAVPEGLESGQDKPKFTEKIVYNIKNIVIDIWEK